jgi:hypothetical protein
MMSFFGEGVENKKDDNLMTRKKDICNGIIMLRMGLEQTL